MLFLSKLEHMAKRQVKHARQEKMPVKKHEKTVRYTAAVVVALMFVAIVAVFAALSPQGNPASFAKCRLTALSCAQNIANGVYSDKAACAPSCRTACAGPSGSDLMAATPVTASSCPDTGAGPATACSYCINGRADLITE